MESVTTGWGTTEVPNVDSTPDRDETEGRWH